MSVIPPAPSIPLPPAPTVAYKREQAALAKQSEAQSWGESVRRYDAARTQPLHPALLHPTVPHKSGLYNNTLVPPPFNPVAQRWTDSARENAAFASEQSALADLQRNAAYRRDHLANHKGFDMLSGVRVATTNLEVDAMLTRQDSSHPTKIHIDKLSGKRIIEFNFPPTHPRARDYDLITTKDRFVESAERLEKIDLAAAPGKGGPRHTAESRDFNIVSNNFQRVGVGIRSYDREIHDERSLEERSRNSQELREKYYELRHYNPLTTQFYHPDEEKRFQNEKKFASASHGQLALSALPPSIKRSEGLQYDILAPVRIKDSQQLQTYYEINERTRREAHQLPFQYQRMVQQRDIQMEHAAAVASANRISTRRYEEQFKRGHDIVSNEPLEGRLAKQNVVRPTAHMAGAARRAQLQAGGKQPAGRSSSS